MTQAAVELGLTQSGVSQHIRALEDVLGLSLFDRIKKKLVPTPEARQLFERISVNLNDIEKTLWRVKGESQQLTGLVSIGMPVEFGMNIVQPLISQFLKEHPGVQVRMHLDLAPQMSQWLLKGDLDMAFVDNLSIDKRLNATWVYDEVLDLCGSVEYMSNHYPILNTKKYFEGLDYVEYKESETILRQWFSYHLRLKHPHLNIRAFVADTKAVARFISAGLGLGIIPRHVHQKLSSQGHHFIKVEGSGKQLLNPIRLAYLEDRSFTPAADALIEFLLKELQAVSKLRREQLQSEPYHSPSVIPTDFI